MSKWPLVEVADIAAPHTGAVSIGPFGSAMKADCYVDRGVPVIRGTNLTHGREFSGDFKYVTEETADRLSRSNVYAGDLVFPHRGAIGEVGIVPKNGAERWMLSTSLMKLTCDPERAVPEYVYYFFRSNLGRHELLQYSSSVGTPGIGQPLTSLKSCVLPLPPLRTQRRIASILSAYDALIENNRRRIQLLEQGALLLFREWFVYLRFPGRERAVSDGVPQGWEKKTVPDVIEINPKAAVPRGTPIRYIPMAGLSTSGMSVDLSETEVRAKSTSVRFRNGDTLFARITPCLENGKTGFVDFLHDKEVASGSTEFIVLRGRGVSPFFVYCLARTHGFREIAIKSMIGSSGRQRVQPSCFDDFVVALPPSMLLDQFDQRCEQLFRQIKGLSAQIRLLAQARDLLLPRLLNGEMAV